MGAAARPGRAPAEPRFVRAPNASPLTLDGTRTYLVGRRRVAILDPGPNLVAHLQAVAAAVGDGVASAILLTHGHPDHAAGADRLARLLGVPVRAVAAGTLADGDVIETDAGRLVALATPGHAPDHVAFHWQEAEAVFCGDLMLGGQESTLVAPPEGDLGEYLASLERLRALAPRIILPTHGEPFRDADAALARYLAHRHEREAQVLAALAHGPADPDTVLERVYGLALDPRLRAAAAGATLAYLEHLHALGRVRLASDGRWAAA